MDHTRLAGRRLGYRPQLDGIRAFAVCAVMFYHLYLSRDLSKIAVVLAAGICSAWLLGLLLFNGRNDGRLYFGTDTRAAALLIGCLGAVVFKSGWLVKISGRTIELATMAALAALAIFAFTRYNITQYPGISPYFGDIDLVALVLVLGVLECPEGYVAQLFRTRRFTAIGRLSYGLYLWSFPVDHLLEAKLHQSKTVVIPIELVLTAALAVASFSIVERPFLRLKRHFGGRVAATSGAWL